MERSVELLEGFIGELESYCESFNDTERWYANMNKNLLRDQEVQRASNEENFRRVQNDFRQRQEKSVSDQDLEKQKIRSAIAKKEVLLEKNLQANVRVRDEILSRVDRIVRPEYFRYAYRYREYGDFHPEIRKLEEVSKVDLDAMVEAINDGDTPMWVNHLKALLRSEDMLLEYAEFANLLGKARYLCEVENDALRDQAQMEILQLQLKMEELDRAFVASARNVNKKKQKIAQDNSEFKTMFENNCETEVKNLREDYRNRQLKLFESMRRKLKEVYPVESLREVYETLGEADRLDRHLICADGSPLRVKLGLIWQDAQETLNNDQVRKMLERDYPFMIQEGRFSIPGIA